MIIKEYWFNLLGSFCMLMISIALTISYSWEVSFYTFGLTLLMLAPPIREVYSKLASRVKAGKNNG